MNKLEIYENYSRNYNVCLFKGAFLWVLLLLSLAFSACSDLDELNDPKSCVVIRDREMEMGERPKEILHKSLKGKTPKGSKCQTVEYPIEKDVEKPVEPPKKPVEPPKEPVEPPKEPVEPPEESAPIVKIIFENERVNGELFVDHVDVGDLIVVHISSGSQLERRFSEPYEETVNSSWIIKECSGPNKYGREECRHVPHKGKCKISYRDYLGEIESPIKLQKEPKNIPLNLRIGKHNYYFDRIEFYDDSSVSFSFKIHEKMLQGTNELYLQPVRDIKNHVQIGFIDYASCPHQKKDYFSIGEAAASTTMPNDIRREFEVSLKIIRGDSREDSDGNSEGE